MDENSNEQKIQEMKEFEKRRLECNCAKNNCDEFEHGCTCSCHLDDTECIDYDR